MATDGWIQALQTALNHPGWIEHKALVKLIRNPLEEVAFFYLTQEKNKRGRPLNPVANFHLSNGATVNLSHVNLGANRSEKGLAESCGLMVNYIYSQPWLNQIGRTVKGLLPWEGVVRK